MSFYGTSFYELKEYFKRFLFQNKEDEPLVFEPNDIFDSFKQKSDHWIRFDKETEYLSDGSETDILLISHNLPNKENYDIGGLRFYDNLSEAYEKEIEQKVSKFFDSIYHKKVVELVNKSKTSIALGQVFSDTNLDLQIKLLLNDIEINLQNEIELINSYFIDYLGIKVSYDSTTKMPKGPYQNIKNDLIVESILNLINPNTIATLPDFDIDKRGHMIFKGNKVFTFPDNIIGFIHPTTKEIIKVNPKNVVDGDGSYILFSGNDYIDFSFNETNGSLQINHKKGDKDDGIQRKSTIPKHFNSIQEAISALAQEGIKDSDGNEYTYEILEKKIQSYRSGNILQVPNFQYDEYGHLIQDKTEPYSYLRLDMADSYKVVNFSIKFDKDWTLVGDETGTTNDNSDLMELSIYKKPLTEAYEEKADLQPYMSCAETIFNVACDNNTRLKLLQLGINEFWIDTIKGTPTMFVRGDSSAFNTGSETIYAFQAQVINSYDSAAAAEGINGAVIALLGYNGKEDYSDYGICNKTYNEIDQYLTEGKMVLCYEPGTGNYYIPSGRGEDKDLGKFITFSSVTNKNSSNFYQGRVDATNQDKDPESYIVSVKVTIAENGLTNKPETIGKVKGEQKFYFRVVDYNLGEKINSIVKEGQDFIDNLSEEIKKIAKEAFSPYIVLNSQLNNTTLENIRKTVNNGCNVYYSSDKGILLLSSLKEKYATFIHSTINNGLLEMIVYTIDEKGNITTEEFNLDKNKILPSGGQQGQVLMLDSNLRPYWTTLSIPKIISTDSDIGVNSAMEDNSVVLVYEK